MVTIFCIGIGISLEYSVAKCFSDNMLYRNGLEYSVAKCLSDNILDWMALEYSVIKC